MLFVGEGIIVQFYCQDCKGHSLQLCLQKTHLFRSLADENAHHWVSFVLCCVGVHVLALLYVTCRCCSSLFPCVQHPDAWQDSLGTGVNRLCLRKSQIQNVCELAELSPTCHCWCFTSVMLPLRNIAVLKSKPSGLKTSPLQSWALNFACTSLLIMIHLGGPDQ